jgi:hypothetical protein
VLKLSEVHAQIAGRSPSVPEARGRRRKGCSGEGAVPAPPDRARGDGSHPTQAPECGSTPQPPAPGSEAATARTSSGLARGRP